MQASQSLVRIKDKIKQQREKAKTSLNKIKKKWQERRINAPLVLTSCRILLSPLIFLAVLAGRQNIGLLLFLFATLTDALDGYLARKYKQETDIGSALDPLADKVLINSTTGSLIIFGGFPIWLFSIFIVRDIFLVLGGAYAFAKHTPLMKPTPISKLSTFFQVLTIIGFFTERLFMFFAVTAIFLTVASGLDYSRRFYRSTNLRIPSTYHFRMLMALPDFFTLANAGCGFLSIILSLGQRHSLAAMLLVASAFFDFIDGKVARKIHREGSFGKELDSLADVLSFGVAPAVLGMSIVNDMTYFLIFFFFLASGILRLARYNIMQEQGVFYGLPITVSGIVIPVAFFFSTPTVAYPIIFLLLGLAMIAPIKLSKLHS